MLPTRLSVFVGVVVAEHVVRHGRSATDGRDDHVAVDDLGDVGGLVAYRVADLLDRDAVATHDRDGSVAALVGVLLKKDLRATTNMETNVNYTVVGAFVITMVAVIVLTIIWLSAGLNGWRGLGQSMAGLALGAVIFAVLQNGVQLLGINQFWLQAVIGAAILVTVSVIV